MDDPPYNRHSCFLIIFYRRGFQLFQSSFSMVSGSLYIQIRHNAPSALSISMSAILIKTYRISHINSYIRIFFPCFFQFLGYIMQKYGCPCIRTLAGQLFSAAPSLHISAIASGMLGLLNS